jgi:hypothetical protein
MTKLPDTSTSHRKGWTTRKLKTFSAAFSDKILRGRPSKGHCAMISWALSGYLSFMGLPNEVCESQVGRGNHLWIRLFDEMVIDCTADQFNRGKRKHPRVHVGKPLDIHKGGKRYAA